ncbi:bifunctional hydroxymethylpyrimidine kinase/phosphomethylpyrimidine kinase [Solicola gregarius]|uniref:Bifunctional hydroxymethylpyrimidine kinase/phosphomethylpyrimidine kinase n=1 Tax=Solicola gregarius TaxID=2908642 RepID=A0AA46TIA1_9ACTN|nr:bifunctional hydroxymethylpyrimidine kinase/phosphomethylpyrimidine kinase [Solicola gregarius]UYM05806.1 bifunctional hydroxymethylpyrimidine kinase/phosphomethylpyrimidine kinase [Solicola gregarius]
MAKRPAMLSIAGSDPSGGAGIQADLKTATALKVYGAAVITSLTAQNTRGVTGILPIPAEFVVQQYEEVVTDLDVEAVKIGMLGTAEVVVALAESMRRHPVRDVVLDPVMVATSGDRLVPTDTVDAIREHLLPLATVVTPNLPEAAVLAGVDEPGDRDSMIEAATALRDLGAQAALVKGGHGSGASAIDILVDAEGPAMFVADRVETANTHGTGCTLSSAVATYLIYPMPLRDAIHGAKRYVSGAIESAASWTVGEGRSPVNHLWELEGGLPPRGSND